MNNTLTTFEATVEQIQSGRHLIISADESFLERLPKGSWIGGTSPYSMSAAGGAMQMSKAFVQELSDVHDFQTKFYGKNEIQNVYVDGPDSGYSVILAPAFTDVIGRFAVEVPTFPQFGQKPLIGWVTGTKLDMLGQHPARVYDGKTGTSATDKAIVAHIQLPKNKFADISTVNIFDVNPDGDVLQFETNGSEVTDVSVNGKTMEFKEYIEKNKIDLRWPLVGQYHGAMVNASFMPTETVASPVKLFAPVFRGVKYQLAKPVGDYSAYLEAFRKKMPQPPKSKIAVTCNCMFNYLYGSLEGKTLDELNGPFVFGEIAYQLFNQTLVYLTVEDKTA